MDVASFKERPNRHTTILKHKAMNVLSSWMLPNFTWIWWASQKRRIWVKANLMNRQKQSMMKKYWNLNSFIETQSSINLWRMTSWSQWNCNLEGRFQFSTKYIWSLIAPFSVRLETLWTFSLNWFRLSLLHWLYCLSLEM